MPLGQQQRGNRRGMMMMTSRSPSSSPRAATRTSPYSSPRSNRASPYSSPRTRSSPRSSIIHKQSLPSSIMNPSRVPPIAILMVILGCSIFMFLGMVQNHTPSSSSSPAMVGQQKPLFSKQKTKKNIPINTRSSPLPPDHPRWILVDPTSLLPIFRHGPVFTNTSIAAFVPEIVASKLPSEKIYHHHGLESEQEETQCPYIADWEKEDQRAGRPNCNIVHEVIPDAGGFLDSHKKARLHYLASGGYKTAWSLLQTIRGTDGKLLEVPLDVVLKTQNFRREFFERDLEKQQKDALIMERASSSPYVLDQYSYCFYSSLVQWAPYTLDTWLDYHQEEATPLQLLEMTTAIAISIREIQNFVYIPEKDVYVPTFVHMDIKPSQFLMVTDEDDSKDGVVAAPKVLLNDFNRGRFLTSKSLPTICPWIMNIKHNGNRLRGPEEFIHDGEQTDKVDVHAFGSMVFWIVTGDPPFEGMKYDKAMKKITSGAPVEYPPKVLEAARTDPAMAVLVETIAKCRQADPKKRPSAKEIADELEVELARIKANKR